LQASGVLKLEVQKKTQTKHKTSKEHTTMLRAPSSEVTPLSVCINVFTFIGAIVMFICSIIIANQNSTNPCAEDDDAIALAYTDWLWYFGVLGLCTLGIVVLLGAAAVFVNGLQHLTKLIVSCSLCLFITLTGFWLAWMIVGSILYFHDIHGTCPAGETLRQFGLAVFIIWVIQTGLGCMRSCCRD